MKSVRDIYKIGKGPSSSHTMGPFKAVRHYMEYHHEADHLHVTLYGSLAATGKGHLTDKAILDVLETDGRKVDIIWKNNIFLPFHPNGMTFRALDNNGYETDSWTVYSIGGGALAEEGEKKNDTADVYEMCHMNEILEWCRKNGRTYWEYVEAREGKEIWKCAFLIL